MFLAQLSKITDQGISSLNDSISGIIQEFKKECLECAKNGKCYNRKEIDVSHLILNSHKDIQTFRYVKVKELCRKQLKSFKFHYSGCLISKKKKTNTYNLMIYANWIRCKKSVPKSNVNLQCPICWDNKPLYAFTACGHLICESCSQQDLKQKCPFCRTEIADCIPLYV